MFEYLGAPGVAPGPTNPNRRSSTPGVNSGRSSTPTAAAGRSSTPGGGAGGSRMSTPAGSFPAHHPPPLHGHSNLNPARGEDNAAFLADLSNVRMPPVADATTRAFSCDVCGTALPGRPRVECLECRHLVCSHCYNFEKVCSIVGVLGGEIWLLIMYLLHLDRPGKPQIEPSTADAAAERLPKAPSSPRTHARVLLRLLP